MFLEHYQGVNRPDRSLYAVAELKRLGVELEFTLAEDGELLDSFRGRILHKDLPVKVLGWQVRF